MPRHRISNKANTKILLLNLEYKVLDNYTSFVSLFILTYFINIKGDKACWMVMG